MEAASSSRRRRRRRGVRRRGQTAASRCRRQGEASMGWRRRVVAVRGPSRPLSVASMNWWRRRWRRCGRRVRGLERREAALQGCGVVGGAGGETRRWPRCRAPPGVVHARDLALRRGRGRRRRGSVGGAGSLDGDAHLLAEVEAASLAAKAADGEGGGGDRWSAAAARRRLVGRGDVDFGRVEGQSWRRVQQQRGRRTAATAAGSAAARSVACRPRSPRLARTWKLAPPTKPRRSSR